MLYEILSALAAASALLAAVFYIPVWRKKMAAYAAWKESGYESEGPHRKQFDNSGNREAMVACFIIACFSIDYFVSIASRFHFVLVPDQQLVACAPLVSFTALLIGLATTNYYQRRMLNL